MPAGKRRPTPTFEVFFRFGADGPLLPASALRDHPLWKEKYPRVFGRLYRTALDQDRQAADAPEAARESA